LRSPSRREFLKASALAAGAACLEKFQLLAATQRGKVKITDVKVMMLQGPRTYTLVKVLTDAGLYGIGEGYGSPGVGIKEGVLQLRPYFIGKDPLDVEALYTGLGQRVDGSAHMLLRAVAGVEMALWDVAGKILNVPAATLLGGQVRNAVRVYHDEGPRNMLDKASCAEWAARMKESPQGWTGFKFGPSLGIRGIDMSGAGAERTGIAPRQLSRKELMDIRQGFENCREAIGWDRDIMFHGQWNYDLNSAIQLCETLEPVKPLWVEDPMPPEFSEEWVHLTAVSKVPILTGENLGRRQTWRDFFLKKGLHIGQPDIRNTGGLLESKKIADLAELCLIPMCAHDTAAAVANIATVHWASTVRDFLAAETVIGTGGWMDDVIVHDGPLVRNSHMTVPDKPGLGAELNPDVVKPHLAKDETYWG
jgi:L-alanine-DL-glutamate epimerase-like enolase superfamily enzyme